MRDALGVAGCWGVDGVSGAGALLGVDAAVVVWVGDFSGASEAAVSPERRRASCSRH